MKPVFLNFDFLQWPDPDLLIGSSSLRCFSLIEEAEPNDKPGVIAGFGPA
jgi:hypothetical protein